MIEQGILGKVKWFNLKSGFGYVTRDDNGQDVYAHYTSVAKKNPDHRLRSLGEGELVKFNIVDTTKGLEAIEITGPNGEAVLGSEYARPNSRRREPNIMGNNSASNNNSNRMPRRGPRRAPPPSSQMQQESLSPRRRRPARRSESGGGGGGGGGQRRLNGGRMSNNNNSYNDDDNRMRRPVQNNRRRGAPMNPRNNYAPNPYNNSNFYNSDEPLYLSFKPSKCTTTDRLNANIF